MRIKHIIIILSMIIVSPAISAQDDDKYMLFRKEGYTFPYNLAEPDKSWELPKKLVEISGLSFIDKDKLACVQDEKGNLYIFNLQIGEVERKIDFGEDGDYEGIEIIGTDAWILKSNGTLFKVENYLDESGHIAIKYTTDLSKKNDAEGLGFDPINQNLLIACKGHPFVDEKAGKEFKSIYNFSLNKFTLDLDPFLLVEMDTIKFYKNYNTMTQMGIELLAYFDDSKGDLSFQPSGIAIHPLTGNIYIIGSVGNLLLVFSRANDMLAIVKLRSKYYEQPEGICFDPDGILYISNEGNDKAANILKFEKKGQN